MTQPIWQTSRFAIDLTQPKVMGIVNLTPDSFSDGGRHSSLSIALENAQILLAQGADILDIGGESSRPGAEPVSVEEELKRVLPFLQEALTWNVPISVDTYKPEVMQAALDLGTDVVNDIWALRQAGALQVVARHPQCGVCLMHMHREPQTMQVSPMEGEVLAQVLSFLSQRALALTQRGVAKARIVLDPGIGFGKTAEQNFSLLAQQQTLLNGGYPLLAGWSRKRSLASSLDLPSAAGTDMPHPRMVASVKLLAVMNQYLQFTIC